MLTALIRRLAEACSLVELRSFLLIFPLAGVFFTCSIFTNPFQMPELVGFFVLLHYAFTIAAVAALLLCKLNSGSFSLHFSRPLVLILIYVIESRLSRILHSYGDPPLLLLTDGINTTLNFLIMFSIIQLFSVSHNKYFWRLLTAFSVVSIAGFAVMSAMDITYKYGFFTDRNQFALYLLIINTYVVHKLISPETRGIQKLGFSVLAAALLSIIALTQSRSGYIIYLISMAYLVYTCGTKKIRIIAATIGTALIIPLLVLLMLSRVKSEKMAVSNFSDIGRYHAALAGINMVKEHPLVGVGFRQSSVEKVYRIYQEKNAPGLAGVHTIHNVYLEIAAEQGIIGLFIFAMFNFELLVRLWTKIPLVSREHRKDLHLLFIALLSYQIFAMVYHTFDHHNLYWILLALAIIALRDIPQESDTIAIQARSVI